MTGRLAGIWAGAEIRTGGNLGGWDALSQAQITGLTATTGCRLTIKLEMARQVLARDIKNDSVVKVVRRDRRSRGRAGVKGHKDDEDPLSQ